jgi:hypothetical protein
MMTTSTASLTGWGRSQGRGTGESCGDRNMHDAVVACRRPCLRRLTLTVRPARPTKTERFSEVAARPGRAGIFA